MTPALVAAAAFGVTGAVPNTDSTKWPAQIALATADLTVRCGPARSARRGIHACVGYAAAVL